MIRMCKERISAEGAKAASAGINLCTEDGAKIKFCAGNSVLGRIERNEGRNIMTEFLIALLSVYAVWSAHKIMHLSAVLQILVRMLGEMLEEEPQNLTNGADRLY